MVAPVDSGTFVFADGNAGHSCSLGSSPSAGQWDVICANSDTVISTPSGFTLAESAVNNQGSYVFVREAAGGEGSTVTITTSGNFNTSVHWSRWPSELTALDASVNAQASGTPNTTTPAVSTGALAESGELSIAFAALHSTGTANQSSPVWSAGYTALTGPAAQSSGASGANGFVAYNGNAGTAAETPNVSWSGDGCADRYILVITFTVAATAPVTGDLAGSIPHLTGALAGMASIHGDVAGALGELAGALTGTVTSPNTGYTPVPGWYGLLNIAREAERLYQEDHDRPPVACTLCGEPLLAAPGGELFCRFDGARYD